jgi:DNA replication protein DnaC
VQNKGNNKITELRAILQRESQNSSVYKISQQPENCENRNDPDLVQAFRNKWWLNQILKRQTSRLHYGSKVSAVTITVFITILEQNR